MAPRPKAKGTKGAKASGKEAKVGKVGKVGIRCVVGGCRTSCRGVCDPPRSGHYADKEHPAPATCPSVCQPEPSLACA